MKNKREGWKRNQSVLLISTAEAIAEPFDSDLTLTPGIPLGIPSVGRYIPNRNRNRLQPHFFNHVSHAIYVPTC